MNCFKIMSPSVVLARTDASVSAYPDCGSTFPAAAAEAAAAAVRRLPHPAATVSPNLWSKAEQDRGTHEYLQISTCITDTRRTDDQHPKQRLISSLASSLSSGNDHDQRRLRALDVTSPTSSPSSSPSSARLPNDETDQSPTSTEYLSNNCVLLTYYSGDLVSHIEEHFSRALAEKGLAENSCWTIDECAKGHSKSRGKSQDSSKNRHDQQTPSLVYGTDHQPVSPSLSSVYFRDNSPFVTTTRPNGQHYSSTQPTALGNVNSLQDDWRCSFSADTNAICHDLGRRHFDPYLIETDAFDDDRRYSRYNERSMAVPQTTGSRRLNAGNATARTFPYRWQSRLTVGKSATADDSSLWVEPYTVDNLTHSLSRSTTGLASSQHPTKQYHPTDMYWF